MPVREVSGEPIPGQLPGFVPQPEPLHARHRSERPGNDGIDALDRPLAADRPGIGFMDDVHSAPSVVQPPAAVQARPCTPPA